MKAMKYSAIILLIFYFNNICSQDALNYPKAKVNFDDYEDLVKKVKVVRQERLLSLDEFLAYQKDENTVILDTRSRANFNAVHIKGAINLPFTEFTQNNLRRLISDPNTRILIYCNNNIEGDQIYFGSKTYSPEDEKKRK
jgi:3-mercaptopyruvate sulfurtransferase SseA